MSTDEKNTANNKPDTGNASNPTPHHEPVSNKQLLDEKAETYLRESGNIEDMPDAQEQQEAEDAMKAND